MEHNRQGEIARSSWAENQGRWQEYKRIYQAKTALLSTEYLTLRKAIRKARFSDAEWQRIQDSDEPGAIYLNLFGNEEQLGKQLTAARIDTLDQLKAIKLADLRGQYIDPYQDWTTYTETDTNGRATVAANEIAFAAVSKGDPLSIYYDFGASYFGATFTHNIDVLISAGLATTDSFVGIEALSNISAPTQATDPLLIVFAVFDGSYPAGQRTRLNLMIDDGATDETASYLQTVGTTYYLTLNKNATDTDLLIYSDAARTNLLTTLSVSNAATSLRYMSNVTSKNQTGAAGGSVGGSVYNLDLQEAVAGQPYSKRVQGVQGMRSWGGF